MLQIRRGKANFRAIEKRILDSIIGLGRYDSRIRPMGINNTDGPALVRVNIYIRSIGKIDDVTMVRSGPSVRSVPFSHLLSYVLTLRMCTHTCIRSAPNRLDLFVEYTKSCLTGRLFGPLRLHRWNR